MSVDSRELKELLLQKNDEYRQLCTQHHELEDRLNELSAKHYLSGPEQLEEITLKKRKLQLKDRMMDIARRHLESASISGQPAPRPNSQST